MKMRKTVLILLALLLLVTALPASAITEYTDPESGVTYTVADCWEEKELTGSREVIKKKYTHSLGGMNYFMYGGGDLWAQMTAAQKMRLTREKLNMNYFSKDDVAEMLGCSASDVLLVNCGAYTYYRMESEQTAMGITVPVTVWVHMENGYLHMFMFYGSRTGQAYEDTEALLQTARY